MLTLKTVFGLLLSIPETTMWILMDEDIRRKIRFAETFKDPEDKKLLDDTVWELRKSTEYRKEKEITLKSGEKMTIVVV